MGCDFCNLRATANLPIPSLTVAQCNALMTIDCPVTDDSDSTLLESLLECGIGTDLCVIKSGNLGSVAHNDESKCSPDLFPTLYSVVKNVETWADAVNCSIRGMKDALQILVCNPQLSTTRLSVAPSGVLAVGCDSSIGTIDFAPSEQVVLEATAASFTENPTTAPGWVVIPKVIPGVYYAKTINFPSFNINVPAACAGYRWEVEVVASVDMTPMAIMTWNDYFGVQLTVNGANNVFGRPIISGSMYGQWQAGPTQHVIGNFIPNTAGANTVSMQIIVAQAFGQATMPAISFVAMYCSARLKLVKL